MVTVAAEQKWPAEFEHQEGEEVRVWLAATNGLALGSGLGTHCNRKRRLNAAVLRARLLLSPHSRAATRSAGAGGGKFGPHSAQG